MSKRTQKPSWELNPEWLKLSNISDSLRKYEMTLDQSASNSDYINGFNDALRLASGVAQEKEAEKLNAPSSIDIPAEKEINPNNTERAMLIISHWLITGRYRMVSHRHNGVYVARDESNHKEWKADTLTGLVDAMSRE